jgi:hypothetical protein
LPGTPKRTHNRDQCSCKTTDGRQHAGLPEHLRRIGLIGIPPLEQPPWWIHRLPRTITSGAPNLGWLPSMAAVHWVEAHRPPATIDTTRHPCPTRILVGDILCPLGLHTGSFRNVAQASPQNTYLLNWENRENAGTKETEVCFALAIRHGLDNNLSPLLILTGSHTRM